MADKSNWFFVYIIKSPSEIDIYHNRTEGLLLQQAINLHNIPCLTKIAISKNAFEASFQVGLLEAMQLFPNLTPKQLVLFFLLSIEKDKFEKEAPKRAANDI